ncbi:response regulator, partial [Clavibacter michiganensis]|uniref:response regulator n=1 Tax=Clavibacter michiganensis TaxID=28447 RepID=UPI00292EB9EF
MLRTVIADDHPVVRAGLHAVLDAAADIDVIGEAATPAEAVALAASEDPDLALMDLQFGPERTGADATRQICAAEGAPAVRVLPIDESAGELHVALAAGCG